MLAKLLLRLLAPLMAKEPDFHIGGKVNPYMLRWWVITRNKLFNIYLHEFRRSDDDRAHHDHPWLFNISILLRGRYIEHTIRKGGIHVATQYSTGAVRWRFGPAPHMIELLPGERCVTLFITGPIVRNWGFHCPKGWVPWQRFTDEKDSGSVGAGCGDKA